MHASHWLIKTWSQNLNASMHRQENLLDLESSRVVSWSDVVSKCADSECPTSILGIIFFILEYTRRLLDPKHFLLPFLGSRFPLEVAVGTNGRVWISSKEVKQTIAMTRCIEAADPAGGAMDERALKSFFNTLDL